MGEIIEFLYFLWFICCLNKNKNGGMTLDSQPWKIVGSVLVIKYRFCNLSCSRWNPTWRNVAKNRILRKSFIHFFWHPTIDRNSSDSSWQPEPKLNRSIRTTTTFPYSGIPWNSINEFLAFELHCTPWTQRIRRRTRKIFQS